MKITEVRVTLRDEPKLKAFVDVTFDNEFVVHGMKIIDGTSGLFIAMPNKRGKDGKFRDIVHPISSDMRKRLEVVVLEKYEETLQKKNNSTNS